MPTLCSLSQFFIPKRLSTNIENLIFLQSRFPHSHFRKIKPEIIRQVLKESKLAVIGIATKNGIERAKNIVPSSSFTAEIKTPKTVTQKEAEQRIMNLKILSFS